MKPRLVIRNASHELASDCSWTEELVSLSSGDLYVGGQPFGTYVAACYPNADRPPQCIINVVDGAGRPVLSVPFEVHPLLPDPVRPVSPETSPWLEDGVMVGPIPVEYDRLSYTRAIEAIAVARELIVLDSNLAKYARAT